MKHFWNLPFFALDLGPLFPPLKEMIASEQSLSLIKNAWKNFLEKSEKKQIGFFDWPIKCGLEPIQEIETQSQALKSLGEGAICIGIGGSYLGPAAIQEVLNPIPSPQAFRVHWLSNVDSTAIRKAVDFIQSRKCSAVIISKSGGTTETLAAWFHLGHFFKPENVLVITDPQEGELRRLAQTEKWRSLPVPPNIGGRFSVLTSVGLLPLSLQGIDIRGLLSGAQGMRSFLMESPLEENPALIYALATFLLDQKGYSTHYLMPYDSRLKLLAEWYVQLWGESLGKYSPLFKKPVGPTPVAAMGTSDQHSLLQLFKEGPMNRLVGFLSTQETESPQVGEPSFRSPDYHFLTKHSFSHLNVEASLATQKSLSTRGVPTYRFSFRDFNALSLGAFLFFQEVACAVAGEMYGVNAFDQPGVEEAKKLLKAELTSSK